MKNLTTLLALFAVTLPLAAQDKDRAARERAFQESLENVQLVGYFTMTGQEDGKLEKDAYTIKGVEKVSEGLWRFHASIEYGERPIPISMDLPVYWAGDTPVLSVTDKKFFMLGTYSARVMFHDGQYVGTWKGDGYGGLMFGDIKKLEPAEPGEQDGEEHDGDDDDDGDDGAPRDGRPLGTTTRALSGPASPSTSWPAGGQELRIEAQWPSYRGYRAAGRVPGARPPRTWDVEQGTNVRWRTPLAGLAHSSPVVWGDRIYLTNAVPAEGDAALKVGLYGSIEPVPDEGVQRFTVLALDKKTGATLWERTAWEGKPRYPRHPKGSFAASTPATDGKHVVAFFGNEGLYCYDADGEKLWGRTMGDLDSGFFAVKSASWGFSSSPVIHGDAVYVQVDVQDECYVAKLNLADGKDVWRTERIEEPGWGTPTIHEMDGRAQLICNGWKHIGGYDLATGKELWKLEGGGDIPVPTPVVYENVVFITNAHGSMAPIYAIDAAAEGTLTMDPADCEFMLWSHRRRGNYMQTPLADDGLLYTCADNGVARAFDIGTGEEIYSERLGSGSSGYTSSPVLADGHLYFSSEEGYVSVVRAGPEFELVGENFLGEEMMSTPAIAGDLLLFRTRSHLLAVGKD